MTGSTYPQAAADHCAPAGSPGVSAGVTPDSSALERLDLTIAGMTCGHCVTSVRAALESLPGVTVDHVRIGDASVTLAPEGASPATLIEAIREAGFQAGFSARNDATANLPQGATRGMGRSSSCCSPR